MNTDVCIMGEVPAIVNVYRAECSCLMLPHINSQTFLRAVCVMSVSLTEKK